jgi:PAS domain-containing protein
MDYLQRFVRQFRNRIIALLIINNVLILADWYIVDHVIELTGWWALVALMVVPILTVTILPWITTNTLVQPTKLIWQAILHIAPDTANTVGAPKTNQIGFGRELVTNLVSQVYQLASVVEKVEKSNVKEASELSTNFIANSLPLPLIVLDKEEKIVYANETTAKYLKQAVPDLIGQSIYTALDMSFANEDTLAEWLKQTKGSSVTADHKWERVRIGLPGQGDSLQFAWL